MPPPPVSICAATFLSFPVASLVAMTLVDAKTFTIPLVIPWAALVVGIVFHTFGAVLVQGSWQHTLRSHAPNACWAIPTPDWPNNSHSFAAAWWWIGASIAATIGLVIANILLHFNLIRRFSVLSLISILIVWLIERAMAKRDASTAVSTT